MTTSPSFTPRDGTVVNWQYLWMLGSRRLWLFLLCFVPVVLLTIIYLIRAPRVYESTAVVQVEQREQRTLKSIDKQSDTDDLRSEDSLKTIEQNLQNFSVFVAVVSDPKIANDPRFLVGYQGSTNPPEVDGMAEWLHANTRVALRHGTRLIDVTVDHQVPEMAEKLAQAVVDTFVLMNGQAQTASQQTALKLLVVQSGEVKENLQKSEDSLQIYKDSLLLKDRIDDQQRVIDALRQRYREKHPQLIQARMLLADLMQTFDQEFKNIISNSKNEASYWASNSNDLASAAPNDRIATELKLVEARSEVLQKEVDTESALFDNVLKQMRETDVNQDSAATEIRLAEPPTLPERPAKPKKTITLFLGLAAAFILGTTAVVLTQAVDSSIQTPIEAETLLGLPVLGVLPQLNFKKSPGGAGAFGLHAMDGPAQELVVISDPGGAAAEGFRSLRAAITLLGKAAEHRTILFASALPGEGKTFVSCNYALVLAQMGLKTLLVDIDLRRPAVHERFHLDNDKGLVDIVTQDLELSRAVHPQVAKNLDVLTAGSRCPNPAELFSGSGFKDLLVKALARYDRIVFDSSPVNLVSDCLLVAAYIDSVFLVIRATSTARTAPQHALTLMRRANKEPSGLILNGIPPGTDRLYLGYKGKSSTYGHAYS